MPLFYSSYIMKVCTKCLIKKSMLEFSKEKKGKLGIRSQCKLCAKQRYDEWVNKNPRVRSEKARIYSKRHRQTVKGKASRNNSNIKRRMKTEASALGKQFNRFIKPIYIRCVEYREMGFNFHVDHIIPINGENVSGLHVPWNLQIVTAEYNLTKRNSTPL